MQYETKERKAVAFTLFRLSTIGEWLFPDTESPKNHPQQIIRRELPGDAGKLILRQPQLFGKQVQ